ncbi:hypothetical protein [Stenotrophomonas sp.]|uniref:spermine/spermidine synthase domain-containing protein n=1 Tax=Stenotrophomonas sp. TaxID=69392 RepID=UPI0028ADE5F6|nr:hypothetical protein [Stenotrophomonas sp.]
MKWMPRGLAFIVGAASLIQEILWVRLAGFATGGLPEVFGIVLGLYLIGVAAGAYFGRRLCVTDMCAVRRSAVIVLCVSVVFDFTVLFIFVRAIGVMPVVVALMPLVFIGAALKSVLFPVAHHLGSNDALQWKGGSFSKVYFSNVIGCTLGPLVVTVWAMDVLPIEQLFLLTAGMTLVAASWVARRWLVFPIAVIFAAGALAIAPLLPRLMVNVATVTGGIEPSWLVERKEGVVHTVPDSQGDFVYGGNAYDGRINIDLRRNSNKIDRVYAAMAAVVAPRRVLVVGMSGGSWTRVISSFQSVETIDVVEINPAYKQLVARYSEVAPILVDPRINIHIADGRRWLRSHVDNHYDVIVVNSTFHWRSGATMLLSREFFELLEGHLNEGGLALVNTTGSPEVLKTADAVFEHAYLFGNSVMMSRKDYRPTLRSGTASIFATRFDGVAAFNANRVEDQRAIAAVVNAPLLAIGEVELRSGRSAEINTDKRMLTEYKYGEQLR